MKLVSKSNYSAKVVHVQPRSGTVAGVLPYNKKILGLTEGLPALEFLTKISRWRENSIWAMKLSLWYCQHTHVGHGVWFTALRTHWQKCYSQQGTHINWHNWNVVEETSKCRCIKFHCNQIPVGLFKRKWANSNSSCWQCVHTEASMFIKYVISTRLFRVDIFCPTLSQAEHKSRSERQPLNEESVKMFPHWRDNSDKNKQHHPYRAAASSALSAQLNSQRCVTKMMACVSTYNWTLT